MTTQLELDCGVIYEQPPSKEVRYEAIAKLAISGPNRNLELTIEAEEARYVRLMTTLLKSKLTESGYLVGADIDDVQDQVLEQIAS